MKLYFYVMNNFGESHVEIYRQLTQLLVLKTNELKDRGFGFESRVFRNTLVKESHDFLEKFCGGIKYEYYFQVANGAYYFIVNDIYQHTTLSTQSGALLHDLFMNTRRLH